MGYFQFEEYVIKPVESYKILRNCSGCGCKTSYVNTSNFRVNANKKNIDIWLIYQCGQCKHTYNLPIYERVKSESVNQAAYQKFLENDVKLALEYGSNIQFMSRNKAEIETLEISHQIIGTIAAKQDTTKEVVIHNPYGLKLRTDKVVSEILQISRRQVMELVDNREMIFLGKKLANHTVIRMEGNDELSL